MNASQCRALLWLPVDGAWRSNHDRGTSWTSTALRRDTTLWGLLRMRPAFVCRHSDGEWALTDVGKAERDHLAASK